MMNLVRKFTMKYSALPIIFVNCELGSNITDRTSNEALTQFSANGVPWNTNEP